MAEEVPRQDENQIIAERRAKLGDLRRLGNPFPNDFARKHLAGALHEAHGQAPAARLRCLSWHGRGAHPPAAGR